MDVARQILLHLEERDDPLGTIRDVEIEGIDSEVISYHVMLLDQAGLIEARELDHWYPISLTWNGHEFLDTARNDTHWKKAKHLILEKGGSLAFDILKDVLAKLAKDAIL